ncbi:MAG TPA: HAMP domain-containing sensor histidine kinase, partial [Ilumatobacteraceae bacterium]
AALAVIGVAILGVTFARYELRDQVDQSLRRQARNVNAAEVVAQQAADGNGRGGRNDHGDGGPKADGGTTGFQVIDTTGAVIVGNDGGTLLPIDAADTAAAISGSGTRLRDAVIEGVSYRIATVGQSGGYAVQVGRPIDDVDRTLNGLTIGFGVLALAGIAVAAVLGRLVARRALGPVSRLGAAARTVAETQDPTLPVPESGGAELEQLGQSINSMLRSLTELREHERRLIDDAAHELRTPLTSLRTNIELLSTGRALSAEDSDELMLDLREQMEEFSDLVGDLDALARRDEAAPSDEQRTVHLGNVVNNVARRAQRRAGAVTINVHEDNAGCVIGDPAMIERAVMNVLDNAVKWSPPAGTVDVDISGTTITVADRGPGISPDDVSHVFDRFWRAPASRSMPGSGLGLSIVRQVVDDHHGHVAIEHNPGGGTQVRITLPAAATSPE